MLKRGTYRYNRKYIFFSTMPTPKHAVASAMCVELPQFLVSKKEVVQQTNCLLKFASAFSSYLIFYVVENNHPRA